MNPELWRSQPLLAFASLLPLPLGALWMILAPRAAWLRGHPRALTWGTWLATRVAFGVLVWGVLSHPGMDQTGFFLPQAHNVLDGRLAYRDFASSYSPLFGPLLALAVLACGSSGPILLFLTADFIAWRALAAVEGDGSRACWAYVATPAFSYLFVRYAQDEPLTAAFITLAWLASRRCRPLLAGLVLGAGLVCTKPLFALVALPFLLAGPDRRQLWLGAVAPGLLVYNAWLFAGAWVFQPLLFEGGNFGLGPTLWHALRAGEWIDPGLPGWLPCLLVAGAGAVRLVRTHAEAAAHGVWQFGVYAMLAPKFMPMYVIMWAPFLAVWCARTHGRMVWLAAYGSLLPLAWYADSGPRQGMFGPNWQAVAQGAGIVLALLPLVPLARVLRSRPA